MTNEATRLGHHGMHTAHINVTSVCLFACEIAFGDLLQKHEVEGTIQKYLRKISCK